MKRACAFKRQRLPAVRHYCASRTRVDLAAESIRHPHRHLREVFLIVFSLQPLTEQLHNKRSNS